VVNWQIETQTRRIKTRTNLKAILDRRGREVCGVETNDAELYRSN